MEMLIGWIGPRKSASRQQSTAELLFGFITQRAFVFFSYLARNNWLILAQPSGPRVKAAEGTAKRLWP